MVIKREGRRLALDEPDLAITDYLNALLQEVEASEDEPSEKKSEPRAEAQVVTLAAERPAAGPAEAVVPGETTVGQNAQPPVVPEWAGEPFQCLLVTVSGLKLGLPLVSLNSIAKCDGEIVHLPKQPDWHMGLLEHRGAKVTVVDTALLVMPEKARQRTAQERLASASHILIVGGGKWGLLCDRLMSPVVVDPEKVHWCDRREKSPWMAGTLPDQLCVLLDIERLVGTIRHE